MTFLTATILADCLICRPIRYRWDFAIKGASCGDETKLGLFIAIVNFLQDVIVVVLPMPILWNLQMAVSRKAALTGMFGMGILICAVTVYRIQVTATNDNPSNPSSQEKYALIALLTSLETLLGIISACLPILKPITKRLRVSLPKRGSDTNKPSASGSIPIIMRISHIFTASSKKYSSGEHIPSPDRSWYEMQVGKDGTTHVSVRPKADPRTEDELAGKPAGRDEDMESIYNAMIYTYAHLPHHSFHPNTHPRTLRFKKLKAASSHTEARFEKAPAALGAGAAVSLAADGTVAYGAGGPICRAGVIVAAVREGVSWEDDGDR
ncbi:hypothetical protein HO173_004966 [Letharia columbiana]|uniref:Rhodopsin domain-containing protein n=1 Tax=Letharia columbiana TaxID=112416 RepID=A0A8H6FXI7_9LECA|nr:uncharacterized protein HO173_004966 [Letharia columbiana]KAF6236675.1 hypothetical protein HO173_004966 [Letharia columbiana]